MIIASIVNIVPNLLSLKMVKKNVLKKLLKNYLNLTSKKEEDLLSLIIEIFPLNH